MMPAFSQNAKAITAGRSQAQEQNRLISTSAPIRQCKSVFESSSFHSHIQFHRRKYRSRATAQPISEMNAWWIFFVLIFGCVVLTNASETVECRTDTGFTLKCTYSNDGTALAEKLANGTVQVLRAAGPVPVADISGTLGRLTIERTTDADSQQVNVSIRPGTFANWTKVEMIEFHCSPNCSSSMASTTVIDVPEEEFVSAPKLIGIRLVGVRASENTLKAIAAVSYRLQIFRSSNTHPCEKIVRLIANMPKLKKLNLGECISST